MKNQSINFPKTQDTLNPTVLKKIVEAAVIEDLDGVGDITTLSIMEEDRQHVTAKIIAKEPGVICGVEVVDKVYGMISSMGEVSIDTHFSDGDSVVCGDEVITLRGSASAILSGERTALNFLGFMSGIASKVREYAALLAGTPTRILDTRKTIPGLREVQKYAVHCGGGNNHRLGLFDMILLKENHIAVAGGITNAVRKAQSLYSGVVIEVEVETLDQVKEAVATAADILMLDNMDNEMIAEALEIVQNEKYIEVSGNITGERLKSLGQLGVDFISMGELTHTVKPLDLSLLIR